MEPLLLSPGSSCIKCSVCALQESVSPVLCNFWQIYDGINSDLLLLLLNRFSRVQLCATPETAAYQAPPSLGFSRQEHWTGLPFPSPMHESEKWKWSHSVMSDSATPWTAAYKAPPSMGFSRHEYWSGLPLPSLEGSLGTRLILVSRMNSKLQVTDLQNRNKTHRLRNKIMVTKGEYRGE